MPYGTGFASSPTFILVAPSFPLSNGWAVGNEVQSSDVFIKNSYLIFFLGPPKAAFNL